MRKVVEPTCTEAALTAASRLFEKSKRAKFSGLWAETVMF
jgi:hypothetical protein